MKSFCSISLVFLITCLLALAEAEAQAGAEMEVAEAAICRDVVQRAPVDVGTEFSASAGKLYCFTKITAAQNPTTVEHVWYFGEKERARVSLPVGAASWRTYSSKIIQPHETGSWRVNIQGPHGHLLRTLEFDITP